MLQYQSVINRYTTAQFRAHPVSSIAKLMGLNAYLSLIKANSSQIFPILCGLMVYRQLDSARKQDVMKRILALPHGSERMALLRSRLYGLAADIVANPYWFCWTLTDDELRAYLKSNKELADMLATISRPVSISPLTSVAAVAAALYGVAKSGLRLYFSESVKSFLSSPKVADVGEMVGMERGAAVAGGSSVAVGLILLSLLEVNAKSAERDAKKELTLRGLIRLQDL